MRMSLGEPGLKPFSTGRVNNTICLALPRTVVTYSEAVNYVESFHSPPVSFQKVDHIFILMPA